MYIYLDNNCSFILQYAKLHCKFCHSVASRKVFVFCVAKLRLLTKYQFTRLFHKKFFLSYILRLNRIWRKSVKLIFRGPKMWKIFSSIFTISVHCTMYRFNFHCILRVCSISCCCLLASSISHIQLFYNIQCNVTDCLRFTKKKLIIFERTSTLWAILMKTSLIFCTNFILYTLF